jgi:hypothetical protein
MRTKTAIVELLKADRDLRVFFRACCEASAAKLRAQTWQFRDELAQRGYVVVLPLDEVQDPLFELARDLFPDSPGADIVTWAGLLCGDAMSPLHEHYAHLSPEEKDTVDLSAAWERNDEIVAACEAEDLAALRKALRDYEREALEELRAVQERSGAA